MAARMVLMGGAGCGKPSVGTALTARIDAIAAQLGDIRVGGVPK
jgi:shikimate kinase